MSRSTQGLRNTGAIDYIAVDYTSANQLQTFLKDVDVVVDVLNGPGIDKVHKALIDAAQKNGVKVFFAFQIWRRLPRRHHLRPSCELGYLPVGTNHQPTVLTAYALSEPVPTALIVVAKGGKRNLNSASKDRAFVRP